MVKVVQLHAASTPDPHSLPLLSLPGVPRQVGARPVFHSPPSSRNRSYDLLLIGFFASIAATDDQLPPYPTSNLTIPCGAGSPQKTQESARSSKSKTEDHLHPLPSENAGAEPDYKVKHQVCDINVVILSITRKVYLPYGIVVFIIAWTNRNASVRKTPNPVAIKGI